MEMCMCREGAKFWRAKGEKYLAFLLSYVGLFVKLCRLNLIGGFGKKKIKFT